VSHGNLYDLVVSETEFRAGGMHDARSIERAVQDAIEKTLREHPLVICLDRPPLVDMKASPKNFAPASNQDTRGAPE